MSAAIGMIFGAATFVSGIYYHRISDYNQHTLNFRNSGLSLLVLGLLWVASYYILNYPMLADAVFILGILFSIFYFIHCVKSESKEQARQTIVIGLLCLISVMFWAFYFQIFMSLTLFIVRVAKLSLWGIDFPPPYYVGVQSVGMIVLGFFLLRKKGHTNPKQQCISTGNKFLVAMFSMTAAYGLITLVCFLTQASSAISPLYILTAYLLISLAEMLLSPVGLSAVTLLASRKKVSTLMGIFLASLGVGAFLAGKMAGLTAIEITSTSIADLKLHYASSFSQLFIFLLVAALTSTALNYIIQRLMRTTSL